MRKKTNMPANNTSNSKKVLQARVVNHSDDFDENQNNINDFTEHNYGIEIGFKKEPNMNNPQTYQNEVDDNNERESYSDQSQENSDEADSENEETYIMVFPDKYHEDDSNIVNENVNQNGKITRVYENGKTVRIFNNGVKKEIFPDGYQIVYFNNRDIKQTYPDKKSVYYFYEADTTQTTFPDGLKVFRFGNGQIEKHYPDKTKEVRFL